MNLQKSEEKQIDDLKIKIKNKKTDKEKPYVFVSYSSKDALVVFEIVANLQDRGVNVWIAIDLEPGEHWYNEITSAMQNYYCCLVIYFLSEYSITSENVYAELMWTKHPDIIKYNGNKPLGIIPIDIVKIEKQDIQDWILRKLVKTYHNAPIKIEGPEYNHIRNANVVIKNKYDVAHAILTNIFGNTNSMTRLFYNGDLIKATTDILEYIRIKVKADEADNLLPIIEDNSKENSEQLSNQQSEKSSLSKNQFQLTTVSEPVYQTLEDGKATGVAIVDFNFNERLNVGIVFTVNQAIVYHTYSKGYLTIKDYHDIANSDIDINDNFGVISYLKEREDDDNCDDTWSLILAKCDSEFNIVFENEWVKEFYGLSDLNTDENRELIKKHFEKVLNKL
jgi:hypothetical protein